MNQQQTDQRSEFPHRVLRLLAVWGSPALLVPALMLWFEASLVWVSADEPGILAPVAASLATVGLLVHLPFLSRSFWFRLTIIVLCVLFLIRLIYFPPARDTGFVVIPRVLTVTLAELLLVCQVVLVWRWRPSDPLPIAFPCLALLTLVLALNKTLPKGEQSAYIFLVTVSIVLCTLMIAPPVQSIRSRRGGLPWAARFVLVLVCGSILFGTWAATAAWSSWLPDAQRWFATQVGRTLAGPDQLRNYATYGSLTAIRRQNSVNPNMIALKVYSDATPGYLAGRVFDQYAGGRWRVGSEVGSGGQLRTLPPIEPPDGITIPSESYCVFDLGGWEDTDSLQRMTIENDPRRGRVYFTPLGCRYFVGAGSRLTVDEHGIVRDGVTVRSPYLAAANTTHRAEPLSSRHRAQLMKAPRELSPRITEMASQICRGARTPREKIRRIRDHFQNNYEYSLKPIEIPEGTDPLNHFLRSEHPAHCEFFASAAVALLRLQGIPARYATGYRVIELEEDGGDYWAARNRDAHAWAEAYDQQQRQWVIVEATPGFIDPIEDLADEDLAAGQAGGLAFATENASALAQWWLGLPGPVRYSVLIFTTCTLCLAIVFSVRRARKLRSPDARGISDPRIRQWQRQLWIMDRRLKRCGVVRHRSETVLQFARRVRALGDGNDDSLRSSADWYTAYADGRFGTSLVPPAIPAQRSRGKSEIRNQKSEVPSPKSQI